jgi:hypothetical protein
MRVPGESLCVKLVEILLEKGIGGLFKPWMIRREGEAIAEVTVKKKLLLAQAEKDVQDIRAGVARVDKAGQLLIAGRRIRVEPVISDQSGFCEENSGLIDRAFYLSMCDSVSKEIKIEKAISCAEHELLRRDGSETGVELDDKKILTDDWIGRWRDYVHGVSSDEMIILWGKILAGEFCRPGSYSLRTLDFIKNITQEEAELVQAMLPFVIRNDGIIFAEDLRLLEKEGLSAQKIFDLQELGVIAGSQVQTVDYYLNSEDVEGFKRALLFLNRAILVTSPEKKGKLTLKSFCLTKIGKELCLLGEYKENQGYLERICAHLKKAGFKVQIGSFVKESDDCSLIFNIVDFQ